MPKYTVEITVTSTNIAKVRKEIAAAFPGEEFKCDKINFNMSRQDRLGVAESELESAKSIVEELKEEMENWRDSLPENLQNGSKADEINEAVDALEEISSNMEQVDFSSVSFPSMM